ncbi:Neuropeptide Y receptor type 2 [Frankliniella fusca]|uniref:Neuropeptide Y receptor type 2 n=1 Tax=Frankliniella fusca TaxID=407009 RepID=A0AAE1LBF9_9NEOP|nr:Neuropeptide Y receptor type 2 [Frankliniella fusca]
MMMLLHRAHGSERVAYSHGAESHNTDTVKRGSGKNPGFTLGFSGDAEEIIPRAFLLVWLVWFYRGVTDVGDMRRTMLSDAMAGWCGSGCWRLLVATLALVQLLAAATGLPAGMPATTTSSSADLDVDLGDALDTAAPTVDYDDYYIGNMTEEELREFVRKSISAYDWVEVVLTLTVYCLIMLLGLAGNALIIFTTQRYRRMQSTTNVFLSSLAVADLLLIIICIPVKVSDM